MHGLIFLVSALATTQTSAGVPRRPDRPLGTGAAGWELAAKS